jgi:HK97 family phage portal protein
MWKGFSVARQPGQEIHDLGTLSHAGIQVDENTALTYSAVWACVRLLSETIASLPLILYERLPRGKQRAIEHPLYPLLHDAPNPEMTSFNFRESLMSHLLLWGNCYALIDWDEYLTPKALWLIRPDRMVVTRDQQTRQLVYTYTPLNGAGPLNLPLYRVWHIPGLGFDGVMGYSVIAMAAETIGLGMAAREYSARFFGQGTNTGAALKHPKTLSKVAHENLKKDMQEKYEGLGKAHTLMVLEEGMDFVRTTISPEDSQLLQTTQASVTDVSRWFRVQPHMIGDLSRATFSNIEQQSLEYVVYTMRPWLVRWEQSISLKLLLPGERPALFAEHLIDGLLRGDFESRMRGFWTAIQSGILSPNEAREIDNRNPREGGDEYLRPTNMTLASLPPPAHAAPANNNPKE